MELILEGEFVLERSTGKGGWTFIQVPVSRLPHGKAFGMTKFNGSVDDFEFVGKNLMPMKKGILFFPISKIIRTKIGKEEGDLVTLRLYHDVIPTAMPQELIDCLDDDPGKLALFYLLTDTVQRHWIEYIYSTDSEEIKADRIVKLLGELKSDS